jgi:predicted AlkP superfamily pyrophosphatase or phosphodiesterase
MSDLYNSVCITSVEATVLSLMGIEIPKGISKPILPVMEKFRGVKVDRAVLYNPDAVAMWLFQKYTDLFTDALEISDIAMPMLSVMPCVTPVCFASMYSGVLPEKHGIKKYEKPILKIETMFDILIAAGKKVAIVSTAHDSISMIFLERKMDYFIFDSVDKVNEKANELIKKDIYDVIVIYNGNYDAHMHKSGTESDDSIEQLKKNISEYKALYEEIRISLSKHNTFYAFMPDHGCHEIDAGCGSHGLYMEEDMNIIHFYGLNKNI